MPRNLFKRYLPSPEVLKNHKNLQFLGDKLHDPNLWHLNRRSVSMAFAVGLFCAWIPVPAQMALAAFSAFYFRSNLPISVALVWLTNPITMPPLFYLAYLVGLWALNKNDPNNAQALSPDSMLAGVGDTTGTFLVGCFILGTLCSVAGYFGIQWYWRYHVLQRWNKRKAQRANIG